MVFHAGIVKQRLTGKVLTSGGSRASAWCDGAGASR